MINHVTSNKNEAIDNTSTDLYKAKTSGEKVVVKENVNGLLQC
jgi:hypothetical protein